LRISWKLPAWVWPPCRDTNSPLTRIWAAPLKLMASPARVKLSLLSMLPGAGDNRLINGASVSATSGS
tara:strand:- start:84879 stop:85082 length:204 start_codon:yes stop_codon:yes gene_type:complete